MKKIPLPTVRRLPAYLQILREAQEKKEEWTSTTKLATSLRLKPIQVRKDMGFADCTGKPKLGFNTKRTIKRIEYVLGIKNYSETILVGVGSIGTALLKHGGFQRYRMKITAAFDINPDLIGIKIGEIVIDDEAEMESFIKKTETRFAILTSPAEASQAITDKLVKAGIIGILNYTSTCLKVPAHVVVKRHDIALALASLQAEVLYGLEKTIS